LLREDLIGPLRQELADEVKLDLTKQRHTFLHPRLLGIDFQPQPHAVLSLSMPPRLQGRVSKLKGKARADFFQVENENNRGGSSHFNWH
jgi:hypothetical protein